MTAGALLRSCHPEPAAAVTAASAALAVAAGHGVAGTVGVVAAVGAGQLSIGWANDALDAARDARAGRADKPVARGEVARRTVWTAALVALVVTAPLSALNGAAAGAAHVVAVLSGWAYDLRLKATVLSWLPYAVSFALLPAFVVLALPGAPAPPVWVLVAGALLGSGAHLANALPDLDADLAEGVRGLPQRLGARAAALLAVGLLAAATVVLALAPPGRPGPAAAVAVAVAAVGLGAAAVLGRRPASRAPFRAVLAVAVVDVVLLLVQGRALAP